MSSRARSRHRSSVLQGERMVAVARLRAAASGAHALGPRRQRPPRRRRPRRIATPSKRSRRRTGMRRSGCCAARSRNAPRSVSATRRTTTWESLCSSSATATAALGEWQESQRQGALGREELERIASGRAACQARQDEQARAAADLGAGRALEQADQAAAALRSAMDSGNDELWRQGNPSLSARQARGRDSPGVGARDGRDREDRARRGRPRSRRPRGARDR